MGLPYEDKWAEWEANPEPYGDREVLAQIREAKESGDTELDLSETQMTDLAPLAELTELTHLHLQGNQVTDLTPLAKLTELETLWLYSNPILNGQIEMLEKALPDCEIFSD